MTLYRGFSTSNYIENESLLLTDIELVKEDILNHIFTRKGERVYLPNFGTNIPEITFDPLDEISINKVKNELLEVFNFDPRVELIDLNIQPYYSENTLIGQAELFYVEFNISDNMDLNIQFNSV